MFDQSTNFFESICGKKSAGWMDKIYKKYLWSVVYQHKKQPLSKVSACCRCSLPFRLLAGMSLLARCNCNKHYYWLDTAITNMNAGQTCMLVCTCWLDSTVKDMGNDQVQLLQTWLMVGVQM